MDINKEKKRSPEEIFEEILRLYPANAKLELKILGVKERPEYGDKVIRRKYILEFNWDLVTEL